MVNRQLLTLQEQMDNLIASRPQLWEAHARFCGTLAYLWIENPYEKLLAKIDALEHLADLTHSEQEKTMHLRHSVLQAMSLQRENSDS